MGELDKKNYTLNLFDYKPWLRQFFSSFHVAHNQGWLVFFISLLRRKV